MNNSITLPVNCHRVFLIYPTISCFYSDGSPFIIESEGSKRKTVLISMKFDCHEAGFVAAKACYMGMPLLTPPICTVTIVRKCGVNSSSV